METGTARDGDARVEWWRKRVDGETWFIAVNTADRPVSVTIDGRQIDLRRHETGIAAQAAR